MITYCVYFWRLFGRSFFSTILLILLHCSALGETVEIGFVNKTQRLSHWLNEHQNTFDENAFTLGAIWTTKEELARQKIEYESIKLALDKLLNLDSINVDSYKGLTHNLSIMPPTGRVPIKIAEPKWLEAYPKNNPLMKLGDSFEIPDRPSNLRVMLEGGQVCEIPHQEGLQAKDYVSGCTQTLGSWAWVAQPNGRVQRVGLQLWNANEADQVAPGSWIWAPSNASKIPLDWSLRWAKWLANQGISSRLPLEKFYKSYRQTYPASINFDFLDLEGRYSKPTPTASNWGNVGLLQMPTARMQKKGYFGISLHRTWPYLNQNIFFQPMDWLEAGFRYTDTSNRLYSNYYAFSGDQNYKDKSLDLKVRALQESHWLPELSIGIRDVGGTGLYSSEYIVASKRTGRLDWSLGLGFGYIAGRSNQTNPLDNLFGKAFGTRPSNEIEQGGNFSTNTWFRGPTAFFGGVEYQTPWNFNIKIEYDGNDYQKEPQNNNLPVASPINWAAVYQPTKGLDISMGVQRGNKFALGFTFYFDMNGLNMPKITDPPTPNPIRMPGSAKLKWQETAKDLESLTLWDVKQIYKDNDTVIVDAHNSFNTYNQSRLDKAIAVLNRDAPEQIENFEIHHNDAGGVLAVEKVNRSDWVTQQTQPSRTNEVIQPIKLNYEFVNVNKKEPLIEQKSLNYWLRPELDLIQTIGGPDGYLYQFSGALEMGLEMPYNLKIDSKVRYRLDDNYQKFTSAWSNMTQVRTRIAEYLNTSNKDVIDNLTLSRTERLNPNWYTTAYSGIFEMMYMGIGSEFLYRQPASNWAVGLDINHVRQRDYRQYFGSLDYSTNTGHLTGYWVTPIEGISSSLSMGKYLAGDIGMTASITKSFSNGSTLTAFATKTNVSAAVFGEGSFDKGISWTIPFDAFLTSSSRFNAQWSWRPLLRDGGAMVKRPVYLYARTAWISPVAKAYKPSPFSNDSVAPDDRVDN